MNRKEKISATLLFSFLSIAFLLSTLNQCKRETSIKDNNVITIAQVTKFSSNRSFNHYYFTYYYKGEKHDSFDNIYNQGREECVGKFYTVEISSKDPTYSKIDLDKEVKDSIEIVNAGFLFD